MPGIAELALGAAPIAGGALLGVAAGNLKPPDVRGMILKDMDLLERIPDDQPELKARLKASIDQRIDDLIVATQGSRELRLAAASYPGNWRDIVCSSAAVLSPSSGGTSTTAEANWFLLFIVLIVLSLVTAIYAARGILPGDPPFVHAPDDDELSRNRHLGFRHPKCALQQAVSLRLNVIEHARAQADIRLHPHAGRLTLSDQLPRACDEPVDQHRAGNTPFLPENNLLRCSSEITRVRSACESRMLSNGATSRTGAGVSGSGRGASGMS